MKEDKAWLMISLSLPLPKGHTFGPLLCLGLTWTHSGHSVWSLSVQCPLTTKGACSRLVVSEEFTSTRDLGTGPSVELEAFQIP